MAHPPRRLIEGLLATALGLLLFLLVLEGGLRLAGSFYDEPRTQPDLPELAALGDHVILAVGDSMTWGIGASKGMTWPEQLEREIELRSPGLDYTVINGSMAGANSTMIRALLEEYLQVFQPDLVLILAGGSNNTNYFGYHQWKRADSPWARIDDVLFGLRVYRLLRSLGRTGLAPAVGGQDPVLDGIAGAIDAYEAWLIDQGREPLPALREGGYLLEVSRYQRALEIFERAAEEHPDDGCPHWGRGMALKGLRDESGAERAYLACIEEEPDNPACYYGLGELKLEGLPQHAAGMPRLAEAERWFEQGVQADPNSSGNHWGIGMVRNRQDLQSEALDAFMRCADAMPQDSRCYPSMLPVAEMSQRRDELRAYLKRKARHSTTAADLLEVMDLDRDEQELLAWARDDIEAMIDASQARGAAVLIAGYPYHNNTNTMFERLAYERQLPYVDHYGAFQSAMGTGTQRHELFIADDAHCTDRGYGLMATTTRYALDRAGLLPH
jgi:tetratricopeptide (TPR) repeat protein